MQKIVAVLILTVMGGCASVPKPEWPAPEWKDEIIHLCWSDDSNFANTAGGCEKPEAVKWSGLPLVVKADRLTALPTSRAVKVWNEWLGFEALVYDPFAKDPDISVSYGGKGEIFPKGVAGLTGFMKKDGGSFSAIVIILDLGMSRPDVIMHELGHALGLDHDPDNIRSIMHNTVNRMFVPKLEDHDRAAIRERYAPLL